MKGSTSKTVPCTIDLDDSSGTERDNNRLSSSDRYDYSEGEKQAVVVNDDEFEKSAISCFRYFIVFLMISGTIAAAAASYTYLEEQEDMDMEKEFAITVADIKQLSYNRLSERVDDFRSLASTISGLAINSKISWPFFTDPNFPMIVSNFRESTGSGRIFLSPIVHQLQKANWSNYSQNQHWIADGLAFQQEPQPNNLTETSPYIFRVSAGEKFEEVGSGPFLPVWQAFPVSPTSAGVMTNFNLLSDPIYSRVFETVLETKGSVMTGLRGFSNQGLAEFIGPGMEQQVRTRPFSLFLQPVFKDATQQEVVAILNSDVSWLPVFSLISDKAVPPIHIVVDDGCDITFTMKVTGKESEFLGFGDFHESAYEYLETEFPFAPAVTTQHAAGSECAYMVRAYPTTEFYEAYHLKYPAVTGAVIFAVFAFMCLILYLYDSVVRIRQRRLLNVAARSEQILSVLYPKTIRDRLFGIEKKEDEKNAPKTIRRRIEDELVKTNRFQLKSFIKSNRHGESLDSYNSKPIADLFVDATVMFADIAGFTAWSSTREPSQVFTLLETVYRAFDVLAKRRRVFKVETVGDCYVAVTGLPEPTKAHASIMASFAREIVNKFCELVHTLETTLGPDTGDLGIRIGMHSGPITAGVLRGDKSRFQLFGDTVNTCARIESTGERNRIQVSHETAYMIGSAGKGHLLRSRDEQVTAKGKGKLQTYWLLTREEEEREMARSVGETDQIDVSLRSTLPDDFGTASNDDVDKMLTPKLRRLCQWNVDVLTKLLKQIVAHRKATGIETSQFEAELDAREDAIKVQTFILDEVVEIIPLPEFDHEVHKRQKDIDEIELPEEVIEQIQLYVASIALMYRTKNPFHNFEHASHVAMSVSKLLSRIVAAEDVLNADDDAVKSNDIAGSIHDHTYGITSDPMTRFSVILAALVHDVDHTGISNAQLVKDEHMLAKQFKNKSVAEQNSTFLAWELLMQPRFKEFRRTIYAAPFELDRFRQLIANTVLATDIMDKELQSLRKKRWEAAFSEAMSSALVSSRTDINRKATIVIEHLIQASDVAHTMQHWHIYRKWNERLFEEMVNAYKKGKLGKNPADFWFQGEIGFFDFYVIPLAKKLKECGVFGVSSDEYLNYAMENRREWEEKGEAFVAEMAQKFGDTEEEEVVLEGLNLLF